MQISIRKRIKPYITRKKAKEAEQECEYLRNRHSDDLTTIRHFAEQVLDSIHNLLDEVVTMENTVDAVAVITPS